MKKNVKKILWLVIGLIVGASTIVGATTIFRSEDITYSSPTNKTNVKDSLDELYSKVGQCPEGFHCLKGSLADVVELGDYISMTPTSTSYTPSGELTGCTTDVDCTQNTINPSELNLWRVIKKNEDGTIEVVSEYTSSTTVVFYGKTGYLNYVGTLNQVAAQYTNSKYVQNTRHIGYNGQTEYITDTSKVDSVTLPWEKSNSLGSSHESCDSEKYLCGSAEPLGGGDVGFIDDFNALVSAIGTNGAGGAVDHSKHEWYWVASRQYEVINGNRFFLGRFFSGSYGGEGSTNWREPIYYSDGEELVNGKKGYAIRPVLKLKANDKIISGDGKSAETAYKFE